MDLIIELDPQKVSFTHVMPFVLHVIASAVLDAVTHQHVINKSKFMFIFQFKQKKRLNFNKLHRDEIDAVKWKPFSMYGSA